MAMRRSVLAGGAVAMACAGVFSGWAPPTVTGEGEKAIVLRFPHEADLWDAALGPDGRVHVVYAVRNRSESGRGASDLFYVVTTDGLRESWREPRPVPTGERRATVGGERQPFVAVMADGAVVASWPSGGGIGAARSTDGGATWSPLTPRAADAPGHADTMTMAGGPGSLVAFAWTDTAVMGRGEDKLAAPLHVRLSRDGGQTFEPVVEVNADLLGACVCCTPDLAFDGSGNLWVGYRTSEANVKEICIARLSVDGAITGAIASADNWVLQGCPMNGPEIAVDRAGTTVALTWTREGTIRSTTSTDGGATFAAARDLGNGARHNAVAGGGRLWLAWEAGGATALIRAIERSGEQRAEAAPKAALLVTAEGRPMLVSAASTSAPAGGGSERHERRGDH